MSRPPKTAIPLLELGPGGVAVFAIPDANLELRFLAEAAVPHRHDHYICFLVEDGHQQMQVDFQPVLLTPGTLLVSHPGQVHHIGEFHDFRGWVLAADARLISPAVRRGIEQVPDGLALLHLEAAGQQWFRHIFQALHEAALTEMPLLHSEILPALVNACLGQAVALLEARPAAVAEATSRSVALTQQFQQLLAQHFLTLKKPADYAARLHLTVSYLNDTVKAVTGFSVSYLIRQQVLAEARRLLHYTALSVKEIAAQLGYDDARYFIRFFGKGTGQSPAQFRKSSGRPAGPR